MTNPLESQVGRLLKERGLTIATAESITGGLIGHRLTNIAGSSAYLLGGVIAYSNEAKEKLLGVSANALQAHGAVSREVALAMARGARTLFASDLAVSVTGIAGPGGATETKPIGLTFIGLVAEGHEMVERFVWQKDRIGNKDDSAEAALRMVLRYLEDDMSSLRDTTVEGDLLADGTVRPRSFIWQGQRQFVASMGRQWIEGQQRHVLVMTAARETFELAVEMPEMHWMVKRLEGRANLV